jgi:hypothetical protein
MKATGSAYFYFLLISSLGWLSVSATIKADNHLIICLAFRGPSSDLKHHDGFDMTGGVSSRGNWGFGRTAVHVAGHIMVKAIRDPGFCRRER